MEDPEFDGIIQTILKASPEEVESSQDSINLFNRISSNVHNLPKLLQVLEIQASNKYSLQYLFNLIKNLLIQRGSIFDLKSLTEFCQHYLNIISNISPFLINNQLIPIASDIAAYFYRFIYEKSMNNPPFELAYSLSTCEIESANLLGLNILISVLIVMKTPMKHIVSKHIMDTMTKSFERAHLSDIFRIAFEKVEEKNMQIVPTAIDLLIGIFKFVKLPHLQKEKESLFLDNIEYGIPKEMYPFYFDYSFPMKLFDLFVETKSTKTIDAISYFSGISKSSWVEMQLCPFDYINSLEPSLMQVLETLVDEQQFYSVSYLIYKLGKLISITQPNTSSTLSNTFIENIQRFSIQVFSAFSELSRSCFCLLRFWEVISNNFSFIEIFKSPMEQINFSIVEAFINSLIQCSLTDISFDRLISIIPDFDDFIDNCAPLFKISELSFEKVSEMIRILLGTYIEQLKQGKEVSFYPICILLLIITSFINPKLNLSIQFDLNWVQFISKLVQTFLAFITETNPIESEMINAFPTQSFLLEKVVLKFSSKFINFFLVSNVKTHLFELIGLTEQNVFDLLVNRILTDLSIMKGFPDLLISILEFFVQKSSAPNFPDLAASNPLLQRLSSRQLAIDFERIDDFEKIYKIASLLNRIYSMASGLDQMAEFVSYFDEQFNNAASNGFSDSKFVLILFRQIGGALKGANAIFKYTFLFRWMIHNHTDHTMKCIEAQHQHPIIIKAILKVWNNMCVGSNLQLPAYSADGLLLIRVASQILASVYEKLGTNDDILDYVVKMLHSCMTTKNSNFGIMKLYGDNTIDQIMILFVQIIKQWPFNVYYKYNHIVHIISSAFNFIFNYVPQFFGDEDNLDCLLYFYARSLLEIQEFASSEYSCAYKDLYQNFTKVIRYFYDNGLEQVFAKLRIQLLILIDTLFVSSSLTIHEISDLVYMVAKGNNEYLTDVITRIVNDFSEEFRPIISEQFTNAFHHLKNPRPSAKFAHSLEKMCDLLKPYSIRLSDIEDFRNEFDKLKMS